MTNSEETETSSGSRDLAGPAVLVRPRRWPAYVLAALVPVTVGIGAANYVAQVGLAVAARTEPSAVLLSLMWVSISAWTLVVFWLATQAWTALRHPPRIDGRGLWLWLPATSEQVLVPWERVIEVSTMRKGLPPGGLFVYVHDPEEFARGDAAKATKIRRAVRRYGGAAFVYGIATSPGRLRELDAALRSFSGGRHALRRR